MTIVITEEQAAGILAAVEFARREGALPSEEKFPTYPDDFRLLRDLEVCAGDKRGAAAERSGS